MAKTIALVFLLFGVYPSFGGAGELTLKILQNDEKGIQGSLQELEAADLMKCNRYGLSPLRLAYNNKNYDALLSFLKLLSREDTVNFVLSVEEGDSSLYKEFLIYTANYGDKKIVSLVLSDDISVYSEFFRAISERNDIEILHEALSTGNVSTWKMSDMINVAASKGLNNVIAELLMAGFKVYDWLFMRSNCCLYLALKNNHFDSLELMLKCMDKNKLNKCINFLTNVSINENNFPALVWLLNNGASPDGVYESESHLQCGAKKGNVEVVKILLANGADVNKVVCNYSVLTSAVYSGNIDLVKFLIRSGARVDSGDYYYPGPLSMAALKNYIEIVELLIQFGANLNSRFAFGSALALAAMHGNLDLVKLLIAQGADIDIIGRKGTALFLAIKLKNFEVAEYLIKNGADVNLSKNLTPLEMATRYKMTSLVDLLKEYGAK